MSEISLTAAKDFILIDDAFRFMIDERGFFDEGEFVVFVLFDDAELETVGLAVCFSLSSCKFGCEFLLIFTIDEVFGYFL